MSARRHGRVAAAARAAARRAGTRALARGLVLLAAAVSGATLGASAARGQNMLVNPDFDRDTSGWQNPNPYLPPPVFDPTLDVDGSPGSGSAQLRAAPGSGPAICQCVNGALPSGVGYDFGGWVFIPPGQDPAASVIFTTEYFLETGCVFPNYGANVSPELSFGVDGGAWTELRGGGDSGLSLTSNSVRVCAAVIGGGSVTPVRLNVDHMFFAPTTAAGCEPFDTILCLNQSRFEVQAFYTTREGTQRVAYVHAVTPEAGYLWFFTSDILEVTVKVIDGCALNGAYWVFASGLTDLGVQLTAVDTKTGARKTYLNSPGLPFPTVQDTAAFTTCP
jgi:hypothetical protein